jgi:hypothetical protein
VSEVVTTVNNKQESYVFINHCSFTSLIFKFYVTIHIQSLFEYILCFNLFWSCTCNFVSIHMYLIFNFVLNLYNLISIILEYLIDGLICYIEPTCLFSYFSYIHWTNSCIWILWTTIQRIKELNNTHIQYIQYFCVGEWVTPHCLCLWQMRQTVYSGRHTQRLKKEFSLLRQSVLHEI